MPTIKDSDPPLDPEVLASAIVDVSKAAKRLLGSRLTEEAILVLIKHKSKVSMDQIRKVLHTAADLERSYIKSK